MTWIVQKTRFKNIEFLTSETGDKGERRVANYVSPLAGARIQDIGQTPRRLTLNGWIAGPEASRTAERLRNAFDHQPGALELPWGEILTAHAVSWQMRKSVKYLGRIELSIEFIEASKNERDSAFSEPVRALGAQLPEIEAFLDQLWVQKTTPLFKSREIRAAAQKEIAKRIEQVRDFTNWLETSAEAYDRSAGSGSAESARKLRLIAKPRAQFSMENYALVSGILFSESAASFPITKNAALPATQIRKNITRQIRAGFVLECIRLIEQNQQDLLDKKTGDSLIADLGHLAGEDESESPSERLNPELALALREFSLQARQQLFWKSGHAIQALTTRFTEPVLVFCHRTLPARALFLRAGMAGKT